MRALVLAAALLASLAVAEEPRSCGFVHSDAASQHIWRWDLAQGGAHGRGFQAPFHKLDVAAPGGASSFYWQASDQNNFHAPPPLTLTPYSPCLPQMCGSAMSLSPATEPPCAAGCPVECEGNQSALTATERTAVQPVCGSGCSALVASHRVGGAPACDALGGTAPVISLLDSAQPGLGLRFSFSAPAPLCPASLRNFTVEALCSPAAQSPLPSTVDGDAAACAYTATVPHPAACPLQEGPPGAGNATGDAAQAASGAPVLRWSRIRRRVEHHVGADERYEHFEAKLFNSGGGQLRVSFFALRDARFISFRPKAASLGPGESCTLDVTVPTRFVSDATAISLQSNGGSAEFWLSRDDWPLGSGGRALQYGQLSDDRRRTLLAFTALLCAVGASLRQCSLADCFPSDGDDEEGGNWGEGGVTGRSRRPRESRPARAHAKEGPPAPKEEQEEEPGAWQVWTEEALTAAAAEELTPSEVPMPHRDVESVHAKACGDGGATAACAPPGDAAGAQFHSSQLCAVCLVAPKDTVLVPCRHLTTCMPCTRSLQARAAAENEAAGGVAGGRAGANGHFNCPVCRATVTAHFQLYL